VWAKAVILHTVFCEEFEAIRERNGIQFAALLLLEAFGRPDFHFVEHSDKGNVFVDFCKLFQGRRQHKPALIVFGGIEGGARYFSDYLISLAVAFGDFLKELGLFLKFGSGINFKTAMRRSDNGNLVVAWLS